jgi:hypothetical protein
MGSQRQSLPKPFPVNTTAAAERKRTQADMRLAKLFIF